MLKNKTRKKKRASKRQSARDRAVDQARALHAIDQLKMKRKAHEKARAAIARRLDVLETQHQEWQLTIEALHEAKAVLDGEIILLDLHIGEAYEGINA